MPDLKRNDVVQQLQGGPRMTTEQISLRSGIERQSLALSQSRERARGMNGGEPSRPLEIGTAWG